MTADDEGLEALLRARYLAELSSRLRDFGWQIGILPQGLSFTHTDAQFAADPVSRLFVRFDSFPAFSAWRTDVLRAEIAETRSPNLPEVRQAEPRLRAVQILGGERMTKAEWNRAIAWARAHGNRQIKDRETGKWNLSEEEMQEALR